MKFSLILLASVASLAFANPVPDADKDFDLDIRELDSDLDIRELDEPFNLEHKRQVDELTARGFNCVCLYPNNQKSCNKYCGHRGKVTPKSSVCCC